VKLPDSARHAEGVWGRSARHAGRHRHPRPTADPTGAILDLAYGSRQVRGEKVDGRTDIFSLGALIYEMLSGRRPFPGDSLVESGHAILHDEPPPLPGVPPPLAQLIRRCLAKEPEARFQSARDLAFALEALRSDVEPRPISRPSSFRSFLRRPWWAVALLAGLVAGGVIARLSTSPGPAAAPKVERVTFRPIQFVRNARFTPDGRVVFTARQGATEGSSAESRQRLPPAAGAQVLEAVSPTGELAVLLNSVPFAPLSSRRSRVRERNPQAVAEGYLRRTGPLGGGQAQTGTRLPARLWQAVASRRSDRPGWA
jgi:hypothetical protein